MQDLSKDSLTTEVQEHKSECKTPIDGHESESELRVWKRGGVFCEDGFGPSALLRPVTLLCVCVCVFSGGMPADLEDLPPSLSCDM